MTQKNTFFLTITAIILVLIILSCIFFCAYMEGQKFIYPRLYADLVTKYSKQFNVPEQIIFATIKTESNFNANAVSSAGAMGLMQLMPQTYEWILKDMLGESIIEINAFDPESNIKCGTYMISWLYEKFEDWILVFAAYNAGIGNVQKWLTDDKYSSDGKLTYIPFSETCEYVKKQIKNIKIYEKLYYNQGE